MVISIFGGDLRQFYLAQELKNDGHLILTFNVDGFEEMQNIKQAAEVSDLFILPIPFNKNCNEHIDCIINSKPKAILGGMLNNDLIDKCESLGIYVYDYFEEENLTYRNAVLTAEGAIALSITSSPISIFQSHSLVIGYGRIGKTLSDYLQKLGSSVTVSARKEKDLAEIQSKNLKCVKTKNIYNFINQFDFIYNTVPSPVLTKNELDNCNYQTFIVDLASGGGTDFEYAKQINVNAVLASGLPGKFSALSAAKIIKNSIINHNFETRNLSE